MPGAHQFSHDTGAAASSAGMHQALGMVFQIAGSSSKILVDPNSLAALAHDSDTCLAMAGQVGSQVKMRVGDRWLIANIRSLMLDRRDGGAIIADIDFLGEGDEEKHGRPENEALAVTRRHHGQPEHDSGERRQLDQPSASRAWTSASVNKSSEVE